MELVDTKNDLFDVKIWSTMNFLSHLLLFEDFSSPHSNSKTKKYKFWSKIKITKTKGMKMKSQKNYKGKKIEEYAS